MLLTKYHAIIFISVLTMLVLLGLHLLGIASNVINQQNSTNSASQAALARGSSQGTLTSATSTNNNRAQYQTPLSNNNQNSNDYTHPISIEKATINSDRLSGHDAYLANRRRLNHPEYPIDHYQISQSTNQPLDNQIPPTPTQGQLMGPNSNSRFGPFSGPPPFTPPPLPPPPLPPQPLPLQPIQPQDNGAGPNSSQQSPQATMTSQTTTNQPANQQQQQQQQQQQSASSNQQAPKLVQSTFGGRRPEANGPTATTTATSQSPSPGQQSAPSTSLGPSSGNSAASEQYTPPILYGSNPNHPYLHNPATYHKIRHQQQPFNNFQDQFTTNNLQQQQPFSSSVDNERLRDHRANNNDMTNQNYLQQQQPMVINHNNLGQQIVLSPQQQAAPLPISFFEQQQQLRKQHPHDTQLQPQSQSQQQQSQDNGKTSNNNNNNDRHHSNFIATDKRILPPPMQAPYKDVNVARSLPPQTLNQQYLGQGNNRLLGSPRRYGGPNSQYGGTTATSINSRPVDIENGLTSLPPYTLPPPPLQHDQLQQPPPSNNYLDHKSQQQQQIAAATIPLCARALGAVPNNQSVFNQQVVLCQDDADYPSKAVMGALELYGPQILEQIMPQMVVNNNHVSRLSPQRQQQLQLDSLRPPAASNIGPYSTQQANEQDGINNLPRYSGLSPSANYDNLCKSKISLVHPRRAKNLQGQWKVVVNFPNSEKFRGISLSQPVRIEECSESSLNNECGGADKSLSAPIPKTRCLQQYGDHRLVAWSVQRGLHVDMFRLPVSCSCHMRR